MVRQRADFKHKTAGWPVRVMGLTIAIGLAAPVTARSDELPRQGVSLFENFCFDCHTGSNPAGGLDLQQLAVRPEFETRFRDWQRVLKQLADAKMPPDDSEQPAPAVRNQATRAIRRAFSNAVKRHAGDPGPVTIRRLTQSEFNYVVHDLTGIDLQAARDFNSDAVGGSGFTNAGHAQFMQDSVLERYLDAARSVADHAVIGAGPLFFASDPGLTGRELSAIDRIGRLYRQFGIRTAAGEGAEPFGLNRYPQAMFTAWVYEHRARLARPDLSLEQIARQHECSPRFVQHLWQVLRRTDLSFPASEIAAGWQALPVPSDGEPGRNPEVFRRVEAECQRLYVSLRGWQAALAAAAGDEEEASVLSSSEIVLRQKDSLAARLDWAEDAVRLEIELGVDRASQAAEQTSIVVWKDPQIQFRRNKMLLPDKQPLLPLLTAASLSDLQCGRSPDGRALADNEFALAAGQKRTLELQIPPQMSDGRLFVQVELLPGHAADAVVRCVVSDGISAGETIAESGVTSTLLAAADNPELEKWKHSVAQLAELLPEVSHREPAPSDRDPIPILFENTYNTPERNLFHYVVKYHRDDRFLYQHMLSNSDRQRLDIAWTDLLTSFDYHDANLRFAANKFGLDLADASFEQLNAAQLAPVPSPHREYLQKLQTEYTQMQAVLRAAEPRHVRDVLDFAARAWRRPLAPAEKQQLQSFYQQLRQRPLDHATAIRTLVARVLVAPACLYRSERAQIGSEADGAVSDGAGRIEQSAEDLPRTSPVLNHRSTRPISDRELASRLSFFLWSSIPDAGLMDAAETGNLKTPEELESQVRRMLADAKSRRLAVEFFGQWLGFYRFQHFAGIDEQRFPEFDQQLKESLHAEAVGFFEHWIRQDRPAAEILFADYTFLNERLVDHYGLQDVSAPARQFVKVDNLPSHRGGLLSLGTVLATTSAPLRTSAVKRGDWILRRIIGTPVPPPPADAGSIANDDAQSDELTIRQKLEMHRSAAACVTCHARIDPLGFALEHYDPIGRWREAYGAGQSIDATGTLADGTPIDGIAGLKRYLRRELPQFHETLSSQLLAFALGRPLIASDLPLLQSMTDQLDAGRGFSDIVMLVVSSRQFQHVRQTD